MKTDLPTATDAPDVPHVHLQSDLQDRSKIRSRNWPRRPAVIIAEMLAMRGVCEKVAVDMASDIVAELRREGYSLYRPDGVLGA
jgi:hypothetical protein